MEIYPNKRVTITTINEDELLKFIVQKENVLLIYPL